MRVFEATEPSLRGVEVGNSLQTGKLECLSKDQRSGKRNVIDAQHGHPFHNGFGYGTINAGGFWRFHFLNFRRLDKKKR